MMKNLFLLMTLFLTSVCAHAQTIIIDESGGWLESAYVKWQPVSGASSYNVYYTGEGLVNKQIDTQLIRCYADGSYRADVLGLKAGSYTFSVSPVIQGIEGTPNTTQSVSVLAHDRAGFAFSNGRIPGAYNLDGTPQNNAVILYITEETKDTIELTVTGANSNPCIGLQEILDGFKKGKDTRPLIIRMIGRITDPSYLLNGDIVIENKQNVNSHITFEGVGNDATADGWGIRVKNASNIEIRNIGTMNCNSGEGDNIGLQQDNDHVWVHNVDFFYGDAGGDSDQAKGDGALDCKKSTHVTFSYNHFWDSGKSNLLGLSEGVDPNLLITYHHNWYDHSDSRHPRVRFYSAHVYNNYYDGIAKYGVGSTMGSSVFVENNYFRNCKYPMLTSMQGSDILYGTGTFSKEDGGSIKAFGNTIIGETRFVPYNAPAYSNSTVEFDAIVAASKNEVIPNAIVSKQGNNFYNNFDTDGTLYYSYTLDSPEDAKTNVMAYAGRMNGGDFSWTFNNAVDDTSYAVNQALKTALLSYTTNLVCVQGISETPSSQTLVVTTGAENQNVTEGNAIQTTVFTWGGDATNVSIVGLPASGITFNKDNSAKTVTISGIPTADVNYTITTSGPAGAPSGLSGTFTIGAVSTGGEIHNFTELGKNSTFYSIAGNLSNSKGIVNYNTLTLTECLKIEGSTSISFTAASNGILTLVFNEGVSGAIKIDGVRQNFTNGILSMDVSEGSHVITKDTTQNLFYMSLAYQSLGLSKIETTKTVLYPNPVSHNLQLLSQAKIEKVRIYNLLGVLVKRIDGQVETVDMSDLSRGSYLVKVFTNKGTTDKIIIKN